MTKHLLTPSGPDITAAQLEMMRHALGSAKGASPLGWRNYYCAGAADLDAWEDLVRRGLAELIQRPRGDLPYRVYGVTAAGIGAVTAAVRP